MFCFPAVFRTDYRAVKASYYVATVESFRNILKRNKLESYNILRVLLVTLDMHPMCVTQGGLPVGDRYLSLLAGLNILVKLATVI